LGAKIRENEFGVEWLEAREDGSSESLCLLCRLDLRLALGFLALGLLALLGLLGRLPRCGLLGFLAPPPGDSLIKNPPFSKTVHEILAEFRW
jgi:hypothetical protein